MNITTKKTTTIYGVHASDDEKSKPLKANGTTKELAEKHSNKSKEINNEKETLEYKGATYHLGCLEGFLYGNHD